MPAESFIFIGCLATCYMLYFFVTTINCLEIIRIVSLSQTYPWIFNINMLLDLLFSRQKKGD
ncbi:MAG: hypothetical protein APF76_17820 [Desulfitibacter sp. BRH_c19]|nr:MAG: hypothetical protein APF76_17820 [Desulfitibacter sp. BRH_c19]